jgi:Xaa-Pro aminopeptidase
MRVFVKYTSVLFLILCVITSFTLNNDTPQDHLTAAFHQERRSQLRKLLPPNSVAVFFANPVRNRANDVEYIYHQDPDFYYLTGYQEPHAMLIIFSEDQNNAQGEAYKELLYVQPKDALREMWTGKRLGIEGVKQNLGMKQVFNNTDFADGAINFTKFSKVFFLPFHNDVRDEENIKGDLYDLIAQFKQKVNYPADYNAEAHQLYELIQQSKADESVNAAQTIRSYQQTNERLKEDKILSDYAQAQDAKTREEVAKQVPQININGFALDGMMNTLREVKTQEELKLLRKAINISAVGQIEVMKAMHPGMSEKEVQGIHEFVFRKYGAEFEGYPSIVGAGNNGCVLHYIENNKTKLGNDLVLMDLGAEYHGYTADVTRTIPASGKFTKEQKAIYDLVYKAQEEAFKLCLTDSSVQAPGRVARQIINKGLKELGIIANENERHTYFPHGTSHHLGLDVHDRSNYGNLKPGMVITVEPGIYIPEGSKCDKKWWGIAVRIEDDILVTEKGYENLSKMAPRKSEEIEALMAKSSVLNKLELPKLD